MKKYNAMKDKKKLEVLLKAIQRIYDNPEMLKVIGASIIEVCNEESVSPEQVFSYFAFSLMLSL